MTDYYVATDGNDGTGDGSIGLPWLTIDYGVTQIQGGDILYVRGGIYREEISINTFGKAGLSEETPITITNFQEE